MKFGYVVLTLIFEKDSEGRWLGECRELGTAVFAYSLDRAVDAMKQALELHLNTLEQSGERERFFKEHDIKIRSALKAEKQIQLDLPIKRGVVVQPYIHEFTAA